ncbi:MAG: DUF3565 domain-containing protein [Rhodothermales bacterium]
MKRTITGYHRDDEGDWVAELDCGHGQHVRHKPPFFERPWAVTEEGRASMRGSALECPLCDRLEMPDQYVLHQRSPLFDQDSIPPALLKTHQLKPGVWARIHVMEGAIKFCFEGDDAPAILLDPDHPGVVAPEMPHHVEVVGDVHFYLAIYTSGA